MDTACIRKNNKNGILQAGFFFLYLTEMKKGNNREERRIC